MGPIPNKFRSLESTVGAFPAFLSNKNHAFSGEKLRACFRSQEEKQQQQDGATEAPHSRWLSEAPRSVNPRGSESRMKPMSWNPNHPGLVKNKDPKFICKGVNPETVGFTPKSSIFYRVFHYKVYSIHFGVSSYFWKHPFSWFIEVIPNITA